MIEYYYNTIKATAGENITIAAEITDNNGIPIMRDCHLNLYDNNNTIATANGNFTEAGVWEFTIPAEATTGLTGRYWYCICDSTHTKLNFKQPIYLV